jgi:hypothetical protein
MFLLFPQLGHLPGSYTGSSPNFEFDRENKLSMDSSELMMGFCSNKSIEVEHTTSQKCI